MENEFIEMLKEINEKLTKFECKHKNQLKYDYYNESVLLENINYKINEYLEENN